MSRDTLREELSHMELGICAMCHRPFFRDAEWKITCLICFKHEKGYDLYAGDNQVFLLQESMHELTDRIRTYAADGEEWKRRAIKLKRKKDQIPKDTLRQLLFLCHPDKHKGSEKANEITKWLNSLNED